MKRCLFQFCFGLLLLCGQSHTGRADQWQPLSGTSRYKIAYTEQSTHPALPGKFEIQIRFTPRGKIERKSAATEYGVKQYRSHLELYELDCREQIALLGWVDILGPSKGRIKHLQGKTQAKPILPGSVLDTIAKRICPNPEDESEEADKTTGQDQTEGSDSPGTVTLSNDQKSRIESLLKRVSSNEATPEIWKELGNIYFDTDQPAQAIKAYTQALALRPDDSNILNDRGAMYRQTGDFVQALADFEKAFSLDPNNLESLYNSGYIYAFDLNNLPKALVMWRQYLTLESKSETARQVQSFIERYGK